MSLFHPAIVNHKLSYMDIFHSTAFLLSQVSYHSNFLTFKFILTFFVKYSLNLSFQLRLFGVQVLICTKKCRLHPGTSKNFEIFISSTWLQVTNIYIGLFNFTNWNLLTIRAFVQPLSLYMPIAHWFNSGLQCNIQKLLLLLQFITVCLN